jgi:hypothetical protein
MRSGTKSSTLAYQPCCGSPTPVYSGAFTESSAGMPLFTGTQTMRRIEWCGLLIKLPPLMSALSTVVLAGLLVSGSDGLKYYAMHTLRAGLPRFVCGLADGRHDPAWTPLEGSALPALA